MALGIQFRQNRSDPAWLNFEACRWSAGPLSEIESPMADRRATSAEIYS